MKKILRLLLLPILLATAVAWARSPVYTIGVDGLSCPFCAYGIEKQLKKLEGVNQVEVDVAKGQVVVSMNEGKTLEQAQAVEAVKKAGFTLRSFEPDQEKTGQGKTGS